MDCFYCKGVDTVVEQATRFCACEIPQPFIVENVPASVCSLCGDKSFSGETVTALEKIKNGEARASSMQWVQVFDFERLGEQLGEVGEPAAIGYTYSTLIGESWKVSEQTPPWLQAVLTHSSGLEDLEERVRERIRLIGPLPQQPLTDYSFLATGPYVCSSPV